MYTHSNQKQVKDGVTMTHFKTHPLMLICPRKIESQRTLAIDLRSTEPAFIVEDPLLVWALTSLPESFTREEALAVWSREEKAIDFVDGLWDYSTGEKLILSADEADEIEHRMSIWKQLKWEEAGVYHEGTKDYPFVDMSHHGAFLDDNARMKTYEDGGMPPELYQSLPSISSILLEKTDEGFAEYLKERSTGNQNWRKDLSLIFDFCFGERMRLDRGFDEREFLQLASLRKTLPSGGGRHPTEIFIATSDGALGIDSGLYHYNVKNNSLDRLRAEFNFSEIENLVKLPAGTDAVLFFTSLCERAMWRYRDPRSWRAFVIDIGHAEHMCGEVCSVLNYSLTCCHHFDAASAANLIGIDRFRQPVMSIASLRRAEGDKR